MGKQLMTNLIKNATGVILAGGENTRMPVLKAFIKVRGKTLIERNLELYRQLFEKTFIVTNQPELYARLYTPMLGDIYDIRCPATGIVTALLNSPGKWVFVSACDMPFISIELIRNMAEERQGFDAVVPRTGGKADPLFAFYSRNLLTPMGKAVLGSKRSLRDFLNNKKVKYINSKEINKVDAGTRSLINLNTPEDVDLYPQLRT